MSTCVDQAWLDRHPEVLIGRVKHPSDRAHPYPPGSGPTGQTCGTCAKLCERHCSRTCFKCRVMKKDWTGGLATDIRKKDPACLSWEPRIDKVELFSTSTRQTVGQYPELAPSSAMRQRR